ncbi:MAG: integrase/recombinase XerD [Oleiphilaceae bacterium]
MKVEDLQVFFNYLVQERSLSPASCRVYLHGIRFLYLKVLHWAHFNVTLVLPKRPQRIPELLTYQDFARLLAAVLNPKHQALLSVTYGCFLRVSEAVALKVKTLMVNAICCGLNKARAPLLDPRGSVDWHR